MSLSLAATPGADAPAGLVNALTVDVEDWYQVHALARRIDRRDWPRLESRVEANVDRMLQRFADAGATATFFTLGGIAERHPGLVRRIVAAGHELASHGWDHVRADAQAPAAFLADIRRTRLVLEDLGGVPVRGYRAASFSIGGANWWAFEALAEAGYRYSSSIYPVRHDTYGMPEAPRWPFRPVPSLPIMEFPMTTVIRFGRQLPAAGGGWFRLLPYPVSRANLARVNRRDRRPAIFYCHPWEIDPGQPRVAGVGWRSRLRHYTGLAAMEARLARLLGDFAFARMDRVFPELAACEFAARELAR